MAELVERAGEGVKRRRVIIHSDATGLVDFLVPYPALDETKKKKVEWVSISGLLLPFTQLKTLFHH